MKEGFKSIKEILLEVSEDENMSYKEVQDLWIHQREYVKKKMTEDNVYAVYIPYIGTLSLNTAQFDREIKYKNRKVYKKFIDKVTKLKNNVKFTVYGNSHKKTTSVTRLIKYLHKNFIIEYKNRKFYSVHSKCWDIISKYSNGVLKAK